MREPAALRRGRNWSSRSLSYLESPAPFASGSQPSRWLNEAYWRRGDIAGQRATITWEESSSSAQRRELTPAARARGAAHLPQTRASRRLQRIDRDRAQREGLVEGARDQHDRVVRYLELLLGRAPPGRALHAVEAATAMANRSPSGRSMIPRAQVASTPSDSTQVERADEEVSIIDQRSGWVFGFCSAGGAPLARRRPQRARSSSPLRFASPGPED